MYRRYKRVTVPPLYSGFALTGSPSYSESFFGEHLEREVGNEEVCIACPDIIRPTGKSEVSSVQGAEDGAHTPMNMGVLYDASAHSDTTACSDTTAYSKAAARAVYGRDADIPADGGDDLLCEGEDREGEHSQECDAGEDGAGVDDACDKSDPLKMKFSLEELVFIGVLLVLALKNGEFDSEEIIIIIGLLLLLA